MKFTYSTDAIHLTSGSTLPLPCNAQRCPNHGLESLTHATWPHIGPGHCLHPQRTRGDTTQTTVRVMSKGHILRAVPGSNPSPVLPFPPQAKLPPGGFALAPLSPPSPIVDRLPAPSHVQHVHRLIPRTQRAAVQPVQLQNLSGHCSRGC